VISTSPREPRIPLEAKSPKSREFSVPLLSPPSLSLSLAHSLVPFPSLSYAICLPFSRSLSPFSRTAVLVCFIFPSFLDLFANVSWPSVGSCVRQIRPRAVASIKDLARTSERVCERVNERSRGHRARPPFTTVSFVFSLSLSPSLGLFLSPLSLSLSLFLSLSVRIRRTPGTHSVVKNPAAARRSCTQLPLL